MALGSVIGMAVTGFGGIAIATWVMNHEFAKRPDYRMAQTVVIGALISIVCTAVSAFFTVLLLLGALG